MDVIPLNPWFLYGLAHIEIEAESIMDFLNILTCSETFVGFDHCQTAKPRRGSDSPRKFKEIVAWQKSYLEMR